jgi:hypothetical protein
MASHNKPIQSRAARISDFLGLQRSTVGVLAMVILVSIKDKTLLFQSAPSKNDKMCAGISCSTTY